MEQFGHGLAWPVAHQGLSVPFLGDILELTKTSALVWSILVTKDLHTESQPLLVEPSNTSTRPSGNIPIFLVVTATDHYYNYFLIYKGLLGRENHS